VCSSDLIAFEPAPATEKLARKLRETNNLPYYIVRRALSEKEGVFTLYLSPKAETSNSLNPGFRPGSAEVSIRATTLDRILGGGAPPPNVVKIDVETHEPATFAGARKTFTQYRPWIVCELLGKVDKVKLAPQMEWLVEAGYAFYNMSDDFVWKRHDMQEIVQKGSRFPTRDWLFAPAEPDAKLMDAVKSWSEKLKASVSKSAEEAPAP
jgi:FkbM family methyltransferase